MASKVISKELRAQCEEFLKSRKNANNLINIISLFEEEGSNLQPCILALEMIFSEVLKRKEMYVEKSRELDKDLSAELKYRRWLGECYEDSLTKLTSVIENHKKMAQLQALSTYMKLLSLEGQFPIYNFNKEEYNFPSKRLQTVIVALLSSKQLTNHLVTRFQEFTVYQDLLFNIWKLLPNITSSKKCPNEIYIKNFLGLLEIIPLPKPDAKNRKDEEEQIFCKTEGGLEFVMNMKHLRKCVNKVWDTAVRWTHTPATHHKLLFLLLENILPHLSKPLLLTDYFMDSLDMGGPVSMLALQGIFNLIQNHNMDYPNIYDKLYAMLKPEMFSAKYKARFFYLADIFLTSTHISEVLVAAFAKRLARLALVAPPQDIHILLVLIGNLILRHPGLKKLIAHQTGGEVSCDPYIVEERDPIKSNAIESSLWEVKLLQYHILPSVAIAARFISSPLPSVEWDMSNLLDNPTDKIFEKEMKKKVKEVSLSFNKPQSLALPKGEKLMQYWSLA